MFFVSKCKVLEFKMEVKYLISKSLRNYDSDNISDFNSDSTIMAKALQFRNPKMIFRSEISSNEAWFWTVEKWD